MLQLDVSLCSSLNHSCYQSQPDVSLCCTILNHSCYQSQPDVSLCSSLNHSCYQSQPLLLPVSATLATSLNHSCYKSQPLLLPVSTTLANSLAACVPSLHSLVPVPCGYVAHAWLDGWARRCYGCEVLHTFELLMFLVVRDTFQSILGGSWYRLSGSYCFTCWLKQLVGLTRTSEALQWSILK